MTFDATPEELNLQFPTGDTNNKPFAALDKWSDARTDAVIDIKNNGGFLIRFDGIKSTRMGVVAHEANHVADWTFDFIGATPDINNNEPHSYLVGWVADCVEDALAAQEEMK
jgi:hypothetical protein